MDKPENDDIKNLISFGDEDTEDTSSYDSAEEEQPIEETSITAENSENELSTEQEFFEEDISPDEEIADIDDFEETEDSPVPDIHIVKSANEELSGNEFNINYSFKEKKDAKKTDKLRIIKLSVILAVIAALVTVFAVTDSGIIGAYKRNFAHNFAKMFGITEKPKQENEQPEEEYEEEPATGDASVYIAPGEKAENQVYVTNIEKSVIIPFDYASDAQYSVYGKGIICAATNYMCYINSSGETEWECVTSVIDPILKTAGNYILIAQQNGTKICLYDGKNLVYAVDCEDGILNANLSEKGDCVLVTKKDLYKGAICAYNKSGKLIYARSSGAGSVIDAAISPKSRNIAVALLDTEETVQSTIEIFDITKNDPIASAVFENTIFFDIEYFRNTINVFGDNGFAGINSEGTVLYDYRSENSSVIHYNYDSDGNKLVLFDVENVPTLSRYTVNGRQKLSAQIPALSDFLNVSGSYIMYNSDREIITGKASGKKLLKYTASMDIRDLIMVNKNTFFIVYSNSIELVRK